MVKAGNRMWNEITKPNWTRERNSGENQSASTHRTSAARGVRRAGHCTHRPVTPQGTAAGGSATPVTVAMTAGRSHACTSLIRFGDLSVGPLPMLRLLPLSSALLLSASLLPGHASAQGVPLNDTSTASTPITLDQAMADPDWIGPPVERAWWSWDGSRAQYNLKRAGESIRDTWEVGVDGGVPVRVDGPARAQLDAADPAYDASRTRMAFVRNGDIFVRDLRSGALTQVTRSNDAESR